MVRPGVTGHLAPTRDVPALREAVRQVLADPARRAEMSVNCRRVAVAEYSLEVQARAYAALYERLVAERLSDPSGVGKTDPPAARPAGVR
jgi:glycosyltransferase involved in cell wall biosynthesis